MRKLSTLIVVLLLILGAGSCQRVSYKGGKPRPMEPDAKKVLASFRSALSKSDWPRALSLSSQTVQDEANKNASLAEFCRTVLPLEEIKACRKFNAYASKSRGVERQVIEYQWSVSLNDYDDVYWFCSVRKENARWRLEFPAQPLSQYADGVLAERKRQDAEYTRRRKLLLPKLEKVVVTLTPAKPSSTLGEQMSFRLELTNGGDEILYYDDQQVDVNDSMIVTDSKGRKIPYTAGSVQTGGAYRPVDPGQTVVLLDAYDLASQYKIKRPGTYTVQFSGRGLSVGDRNETDSTEHGADHPGFALSDTCISNTVQIQVRRAPR